MPKRSGARRSKHDRDARAKRAEEWSNTRGGDPRTSWKPQEFANPRMEAFFKAQGFVGDGEWDQFLDALRSPLPACFRINMGYAFHEVLKEELNSYAGTIVKLDEGTEVQPVQQLNWVSTGNAYKLGADKRTIRKSEDLKMKKLHDWLMKNTDNGNITRQEAVSMVPPLALDVQPHHLVLDMCAAPGSKTTQMMEIIDQSLIASPGGEHNNGLVVANDADTDRSYMLVHQTRRMNSPLLVICTHKGQNIPKFRVPTSPSPSGMSHGYFDRVLADVPCSGDGTLRKNPMIWTRWTTGNAITLHPLQLMIARRGFQLLKPGGLMVYSTCSMMPYEDEAVVAELLRETKGTANELELVDAREFLPLFKARAGLSTWHVLDDHRIHKESEKKRAKERKEKQRETQAAETETKEDAGGKEEVEDEEAAADGKMDEANDGEPEQSAKKLNEEKEAKERVAVDDAGVQVCIDMGMAYYSSHAEVPEHQRSKIRKSMFPPTAEEAQWMHLEKCLRCVPHDEDTGGFFVATLRKKERGAGAGAVDAETKIETGAEEKENAKTEEGAQEGGEEEEEQQDVASATKKKRVDGGGEGEAPVAQPTQVAVSAKQSMVDYIAWDPSSFDALQKQFGFVGPITSGAFFTRHDPTSHRGPRKGGKNKHQPLPEDGKPKSIFFLPKPARDLLSACDLKIVSAGTKAFEKHPVKGSDIDYRLAQDGINILAPYITKRKVEVSAQDICNLLEGGLVGFSTLSTGFKEALDGISTGSMVVQYSFKPADRVPVTAPASGEGEGEGEGGGAGKDAAGSSGSLGRATAAQEERVAKRPFYLVCFKGATRALNVMCGKNDMDSMKHQLQSLGVLRPKIKVDKEKEGVFTLPPREQDKEQEQE